LDQHPVGFASQYGNSQQDEFFEFTQVFLHVMDFSVFTWKVGDLFLFFRTNGINFRAGLLGSWLTG
jgi:hypothetical protein